jgi:hypothetical protein
MTEFRDLSRLPDDPAYWEQLESNITGSLGPLVQAGAEAGQGWWSPITRQAWALGGLALAAALAVLLLAPPRDREPSATGWLPPPRNDPAVTAFLASDRPPSVATLIFLSGGGQ